MTISVRLCSGRTAFEVSTNTKIDLIKASSMVQARVATKHLMLLNYNGVEISMYPSGRMIIKTQSKEESLDIARNLLTRLGLQEAGNK
jgi:ribonuclease HIII